MVNFIIFGLPVPWVFVQIKMGLLFVPFEGKRCGVEPLTGPKLKADRVLAVPFIGPKRCQS